MTNLFATPTLQNNIFWGNSSEILDGASIPFADNNLVQNGYLIDPNLVETNPFFVEIPDFNNAPTIEGQFHLMATSNAIDGGDNAAVVAFELTEDLAGNQRFYDGTGDTNETIDLGAFEYLGVTNYYPDLDEDNFGDANATPTSLLNALGISPEDLIEDNTDCNDTDNTIYPNAPEICDGKDNDCNDLIDGADPEVIDEEAPIANALPSIDLALSEDGEVSITAEELDNGSTDACSGIDQISLSETTFNCSHLGANSIAFTVTDLQGNVDVQTVAVNVSDPQGFCNEDGCDGVQLHSDNQDLSEGTFLASETISSDETIADGTMTLYQAGQSITLTAGFHAEAGSDFIARIGECGASGATLTPSAEQRNSSLLATPILKDSDLKVSPNPFQQNTLVIFTLTKTSETSLVILSSTGQELQKVVQKEWLEKGIYEYQLDVINLPAGLLYVQLKANGETITKKIIRIQ